MRRKTKSDDEIKEVIFNELKYGSLKGRWVSVAEISKFLRENGYSYNYDMVMRNLFVLMWIKVIDMRREIVWENSYIFTYVKVSNGASFKISNEKEGNKIILMV